MCLKTSEFYLCNCQSSNWQVLKIVFVWETKAFKNTAEAVDRWGSDSSEKWQLTPNCCVNTWWRTVQIHHDNLKHISQLLQVYHCLFHHYFIVSLFVSLWYYGVHIPVWRYASVRYLPECIIDIICMNIQSYGLGCDCTPWTIIVAKNCG